MTSQEIQNNAVVSVKSDPVITSFPTTTTKDGTSQELKTSTPGDSTLLGTIQALSIVTENLAKNENPPVEGQNEDALLTHDKTLDALQNNFKALQELGKMLEPLQDNFEALQELEEMSEPLQLQEKLKTFKEELELFQQKIEVLKEKLEPFKEKFQAISEKIEVLKEIFSDDTSDDGLSCISGLIGGNAVGLASLSLLKERYCLLDVALNSLDMSIIANNFALEYALTGRDLAYDASEENYNAALDQAYAEYTTAATSGFAAATTVGFTAHSGYFGKMKSATDEKEANNQLLSRLDNDDDLSEQKPVNPELPAVTPGGTVSTDGTTNKQTFRAELKENMKIDPATGKGILDKTWANKNDLNEDGERLSGSTVATPKKDPEFLSIQRQVEIKENTKINPTTGKGSLDKTWGNKNNLNEDGTYQTTMNKRNSKGIIVQEEEGHRDPDFVSMQRQVEFKNHLGTNGGELSPTTAHKYNLNKDGKAKDSSNPEHQAAEDDFAMANYKYRTEKIEAIQEHMKPKAQGRFSDDSKGTKSLLAKYGRREDGWLGKSEKKINFENDPDAKYAIYDMKKNKMGTPGTKDHDEKIGAMKNRLEGFNKIASDNHSTAFQSISQMTNIIREVTGSINSGMGGMWKTFEAESSRTGAQRNADSKLFDSSHQSMLSLVNTQNGMNNTYFGQAMSVMGSQLDALRRANSGA